MPRPLKILMPWQFTRICDSTDGARILAAELGLSPGLVSTVKNECYDPMKRARRTGLNSDHASQVTPNTLWPATSALTIPQTTSTANTVVNYNMMKHTNEQKDSHTTTGRVVTKPPTTITVPSDSLADRNYDADYDLASLLADYYTSPWVQPSSPSAAYLDPALPMTNPLTTAYTSRLGMMISELGENLARKLLPDDYFQDSNKVTLDELEELKKYVENRKKLESELNDENDPREESSSNCSCTVDQQISSVVADPSDQKLKSVTAVSVDSNKVQGNEAGQDESIPDIGVASNPEPVAISAVEPPTKTTHEQNQPTNESSSGNGNQESSGPPPPLAGELNTQGANKQPDTPPPPSTTQTKDQRSTPTSLVTEQSSAAMMVENIQARLPPDPIETTTPDNSTLQDHSGTGQNDPPVNCSRTESQTAISPEPPVRVKLQATTPTEPQANLKTEPGKAHNTNSRGLIACAALALGIAAELFWGPKLRAVVKGLLMKPAFMPPQPSTALTPPTLYTSKVEFTQYQAEVNQNSPELYRKLDKDIIIF